jgi:hypothetical protein
MFLFNEREYIYSMPYNRRLSLFLNIIFLLIVPSVNAIDLPEVIKENIIKNTFMIVPINQYATPISEKLARNYYLNNCSIKNLMANDKLNCKVLKNCKAEACVVEYLEHGTAFLSLENGETLLNTAWHVLFPSHAAGLIFAKNYLEAASTEDKKNIYEKLVPEFLLLNANEEIVYDTRIDRPTSYLDFGDPLSTLFIQEGSNINGIYGYMENIPQDYAKIKLNRKLAEGLIKVSSTNKTNHEKYYSLGFAFDRYNLQFNFKSGFKASLLNLLKTSEKFMDFQMNKLVISHEQFNLLSEEEQLVIIGYSKESAEQQVKDLGRDQVNEAIKIVLSVQMRIQKDLMIEKNTKVLFTDITVLPGSSGAALTNKKGEVIGIVTNAILKEDQKSKKMISFGSGIHLF